MKDEIAGFMTGIDCPTCHGARLKKTSLAVTVGGINISEFTALRSRTSWSSSQSSS